MEEFGNDPRRGFRKPDIFDQINEDDLSNDLRMIAEICGIEAVRKMIRELNGLSFYIPKIASLPAFILRYMLSNPDLSLKMIAKRLQVSEHYIRKLRNQNEKLLMAQNETY